MFATLKNFDLDLQSLRVLNEIISEFDRLVSHTKNNYAKLLFFIFLQLSFYKDDYSVEKIKIVGCTYMAACGLDLRLSSTTSERQSRHESIVQEGE